MRVSKITPRAALALATCLALTPAAFAAEATQAEADRLRALFETYVGRSAPDKPPVVTVTPKGESYDLVFDAESLLAPVRALGIELKVGRLTSTIAPLPDGNWRWTGTSFPEISYGFAGQTGRFAFEGFSGEGVYDPRLETFLSHTMRIARAVGEQSVPKKGEDPRFDVRKTDENIELRMTAGPAASGSGIDAVVTQTGGAVVETFSLSEGLEKGVPDMEMTLKIASSSIDADIHGFKTREFNALWTHLVAHHDKEDFTTRQGALKARISALLPLFERMRQKVVFKGFEVETPFGFGSMSELVYGLDTTGVTRDGAAELTIGFKGFQMHSLFLPAWAAKLVPTDFDLKGRVSGYDLATSGAAYLESADFAAEKPLSPEAEARIATLLLPRSNVEIVLDGNRVRAPLYELALDGRMTAGPAGAKGAVTVTATGLDAAIAALSDPKAGAEGKKAAEELRGMISLAEKKNGALVWRIDFENDAVSVNGRPLGAVDGESDEEEEGIVEPKNGKRGEDGGKKGKDKKL